MKVANMEEKSKNIHLMKFEGDASAPLLKYDLPSPSSYSGRNYYELTMPEGFWNMDKILADQDKSKLLQRHFIFMPH